MTGDDDAFVTNVGGGQSRTDDAMILKNLLSMSGVNIVKSVLQFLMTLLMTWFVSPAEFGLVAFSLPFVAFIALLTDMGMSSAMVQRNTLTPDEAGAAVTLMLVIGVVCAALLAGLAGPLAGAVRMDGLSAVLAALSVSVVLSIAALGPRAVLERELRYQTIALVEAGAAVAAAVVCVVAAVAGQGIWALIAYYVLVQIIRAAAFTTLARHQIRLNFGWRRVSSILTFGGWVLASNVLNFAARNIGNLLIGAKLGAAAVGLYGLAYQFMILPLMIFSWPGGGVLMATLSRMSGPRPGPRPPERRDLRGARHDRDDHLSGDDLPHLRPQLSGVGVAVAALARGAAPDRHSGAGGRRPVDRRL